MTYAKEHDVMKDHMINPLTSSHGEVAGNEVSASTRTRRQVLTGGLAAGAILSTSGWRSASGPKPGSEPGPAALRSSTADRVQPLPRRLFGAYVNKKNYPGMNQTQANSTFDSYVGRDMATGQITKVYWRENDWSGPDAPTAADVTADIAAGTRLLVSFRPLRDPAGAYGEKQYAKSRAHLAAAIQNYQNAGANVDISLWSEPNANGSFMLPLYQDYVSFYESAVLSAQPNPDGSQPDLVYNPAVGNINGDPDGSLTYPSASQIQLVMVDYYCTGYDAGVRLDKIAEMAPGPAGFGVGEFNVGNKTVTQKEWDCYTNHLIKVFGTHAGPIIFWLGANAVGQEQIASPSDFKVPQLQAMYDALSFV